MKINYFDLYYTVFKTRDDNEIASNNENEYINFIDFTTPNHYIGTKPREIILK